MGSAAPTSGSIFGGIAAAASQPTQAVQTGFGSATQGAPNGFGQGAPQQSNAFGQASGTPQATGSLFQQPNQNAFGNPSPSNGVFGGGQPAASTGFVQPQNNSGIAMQQTSLGETKNLFGSPQRAKPQAQDSLFNMGNISSAGRSKPGRRN